MLCCIFAISFIRSVVVFVVVVIVVVDVVLFVVVVVVVVVIASFYSSQWNLGPQGIGHISIKLGYKKSP